MKTKNILVSIYAGSLACLAYEIALTRIFSLSFSYHFAFIIISVAMIGIGASGTLLTVFPKCKDLRFVPLYAVLLGVSIMCSYLLANSIPFDPAKISWDRLQIFYIVLYSIVLSVPFLCFGLIVSSVFANMSNRSGYVYAADLIGAGTGSFLILFLLAQDGPERAVFLLPLLPLFSVFLFPGRLLKVISLCGMITIGAILVTGPDLIRPRISPYKPLSLALKYPGASLLQTYYGPYSQVDIFTSPAVRSAPGLSFRYSGDLPRQLGVAVDAGDIHAITGDQERGSLAFVDYLPTGMAYLLTPNDEVLVVDPKGGLAAMTARQYGSRKIETVESDPLVMRAVQEQAHILGTTLYRENASSGLGRSWLARYSRTFDVIDLSSLGAMPGWAFGFAEDYRYTVEAFQEYLSHLKPHGLLSVSLFIVPPPRAELRLLAIIATALESRGVKEAGTHIAAIRSWDTLTIIVKRSELSGSDIDTIKKFSQDRRFDLVYYPGIREAESNRYIRTPDNAYFDAFQQLIAPRERQRFIGDYLFDIRPVHDENPFFHYFLRMKNIRDTYRVMGGKWQFFIEEGYLLPVLLVQMIVVSTVLIVLPLFRLARHAAVKTGSGLLLTLIYFSALGLAFMFVEISLIQKMILPLEHPPYAMSAVILGILVGSGSGSLLSERVPWLKNPRTILVLSLVIALSSLMLPAIVRSVIMFSLPAKSVIVVIIASLAGFLMGIPFPLGLSLLETIDSALIPWAWAVNGCFSVLAPVAAIMIAVTTGFSTVLLFGAIMYLGAFIAYTLLRKRAQT